MNTFGTIFRITTFGESHGVGIGCVVDGCPAGISLALEEVQQELDLRAPGKRPYTSQRSESDVVTVLSGIYENTTTGAPITFFVQNREKVSSPRSFRPNHADVTYWQKYGHYDPRGGGRASARETLARVAAGVVAKKILSFEGITVTSWLSQVGTAVASRDFEQHSPTPTAMLFAPDSDTEKMFVEQLDLAVRAKDSLGGCVTCKVDHLPPGLGDPVYEKITSKLAHAMMSIPAARGFEIGEGFLAASLRGSQHNDALTVNNENVSHDSNHAGGVLGGITTGMPLLLRVAFKPSSVATSDEAKAQYSRNDPCVAIRAVPVVTAMTACVIADSLLSHRAFIRFSL